MAPSKFLYYTRSSSHNIRRYVISTVETMPLSGIEIQSVQKLVNIKYSLVLMRMFRFTPARQFGERYHSFASCALNMEDLILKKKNLISASNNEISNVF
jgi:hypothetical protein